MVAVSILQQLRAARKERNSKLILRRGPTAEALLALAGESGTGTVFWNRRYEPALTARNREIERRLHAHRIAAESCPGNLLAARRAGRCKTTEGLP